VYCDGASGCSARTLPDGTPCPDGDACNGAETCRAEACTLEAGFTCDDGNECTIDGCDRASGCTHRADVAHVPDDGVACTRDACTAQGRLVHEPQHAQCDTGNPCTLDVCDPQVGCTHDPVDRPCDDGDVCNGIEQCVTGTCTAGTPRVCEDSRPCTADVCVRALGCVYPPDPEVVPNDGIGCTDDSCDGSGAEHHAPVHSECPDGACTFGICDPAAGCTGMAAANTQTCDDGDPCDGIDHCVEGECLPGEVPDCDDGFACTRDQCAGVLGCVHPPDPSIDPDDGVVCTVDACDDRGRETHVPVHSECPDAACGEGVCDPLSGCGHLPLAAGVSCDDASWCNGTEACDGEGACVAAEPAPDCTGDCLTGACDEVNDRCEPVLVTCIETGHFVSIPAGVLRSRRFWLSDAGFSDGIVAGDQPPRGSRFEVQGAFGSEAR
jgi:hypothetical protein